MKKMIVSLKLNRVSVKHGYFHPKARKQTYNTIHLFLNKVTYAHQGCIYLIKNTVKQ